MPDSMITQTLKDRRPRSVEVPLSQAVRNMKPPVKKARREASVFSPTDFVRRVSAAVSPLMAPSGESLRADVGRAELARALTPLFGNFTVADAVFAEAILRTAFGALPDETPDGKVCCAHGALFEVAELLEDFIAEASASGPDCVHARAYLLEWAERENLELAEANKLALAKSIGRDTHSLRNGRFQGETFGGAPSGRIRVVWLYNVVDRFEGDEAARTLIDEGERLEMAG
jgi:hypothetical protein